MSTPPDDLAFLEQALRHLEGALSADEARRFDQLIALEPARARQFAALTMQRVQLVEMGQADRQLRPLSRRRSGRAVLVSATALALVVVAALVVRSRDRASAPSSDRLAAGAPGPRPLAGRSAREQPRGSGAETHASTPALRLESAAGDVGVVANGVSTRARSGQVLAADEGLTVGAERSRAMVVVEGAGRLEVGPNAALGPVAALMEDGQGEGQPRPSGVSIPVAQGRIFARVPAGASRALALGTPLGQLRATAGARFRLDVRADETRVEVHEGTVRLQSYANPRALDLDAGALAVLSPDRDAQVERGERPLPIVFDLQADPRVLPVVRQMPPRLLKQLRGWGVSQDGFVSVNQGGFRCSGDQRHSLFGFIVGAALNTPKDIDEAWRVVDATVPFQAADGSFLDPPECDADWIGDLSHNLLVMLESEWERPYRRRLNAVVQHIGRTAAYLAKPEQVEQLRKAAAHLVRRYTLISAAFSFSGLLLGDEHLTALGREFMELGLRKQREDGSFPVHDGIDSIYQGIIVNQLAWSVLRFGDARADLALRRGSAWLLGRFTPAGELDMRGNTRTGPSCIVSDCQGIDWQRLAWGLLYPSIIHRDPRGAEMAQRLLQRKKTITD